MATAPERPAMTVKQYVAQQEASSVKAEFFRGQLYSMVGGSIRHNQIAENVFHHLRLKLKAAPCKPHGSDQRITTPSGLHTYPDVSVVCGPPEIDSQDEHAMRNPRVLIEVLSPSTERYDRGEKFGLYRSILTLEEYALISQDRALIEVFSRLENGSWNLTLFEGGSKPLFFSSLKCSIEFSDIYDDVQFDGEAMHHS